jgi:hypothetical protein
MSLLSFTALGFNGARYSFRRQRFHWPSDIPDVNLDDLSTDPISKPASRVSAGSDPSLTTRTRSGSIPPSFGPVKYRRDELTHVRTIRVFEAFKTLNDS